MNKKIRMGMVGGGPGAFIGDIHRRAAAMDGAIELVCGSFSHNPERSHEMARELGLPNNRIYSDYEVMFAAEAALPAEQRMEFVSIVTPNHLHYPVAAVALKHGFHVFCEKPATYSFSEACDLKKQVSNTGLQFGLAHTYIGYPMVQEARQRVTRGDIGKVTRVIVEYTQGWLAQGSGDGTSEKLAIWRLDPKLAGVSCTMGDIGVHAANLAEFVSGLHIEQVLADIAAIVPGRSLDDDGSALLRFNNGARGSLVASQVCTGEENSLILKIYGTTGGMEWQQQEPNTLLFKWNEKPNEVLRCGDPYLGSAAATFTRTPSGHPEGYIEAFANLYLGFAASIRDGFPNRIDRETVVLPGIEEAVRGMAFIETTVASSQAESSWLDIPTTDQEH